jgi:hypothetical protein
MKTTLGLSLKVKSYYSEIMSNELISQKLEKMPWIIFTIYIFYLKLFLQMLNMYFAGILRV